MGFLILAVAAPVLVGTFPGRAILQEPTAPIDPGVLEALERQPEVDVYIALREPTIPFAEQTTDYMRQYAADIQALVLSALTAEDFSLVYQFPLSPSLSGRITASGLAKLARNPDVEGVELPTESRVDLAESVPLIHGDETRYIGINGTGVNVAVLDTGIDTDHPDLEDSLLAQHCFPQFVSCPGAPNNPAEDDIGHGTLVSGIITSDGTVASFGVAHRAGIRAYKVGPDADGDISDEAVLAALQDIEAGNFPVRFVNMAFGNPAGCANPSQLFQDIETWVDRLLFFGDVLSFASTGNAGVKSAIDFPSCYSSVVAVGAVYDAFFTDLNCSAAVVSPDDVPCWSNSSLDLDLLGPGCLIASTSLGGGTDSECGTSGAVPHAVGVAALLKHSRPDLFATEIKKRLERTGKWVFDDLAGRWTPRVDARVAFLVNDATDYDGDGCTNGQEFGPDVTRGGLRNPLDPWDFYDTNGDGIIDLLNDIRGVIARWGTYPGGPPNPDTGLYYDPAYDRGPVAGPHTWNMTAPDGVIDLLNDIRGVINQWNHDCRP